MNELEQVRTPELIGAEIRLYYEAGRRVTMLCGIEIGRRLNEAKEMLQHGEWIPWLQRETPFSERHAQNYMKIFREYGSAQQGLFGPETNAKYIADLPISKALLLLSVPEEDRDEFAESVEADKLSAEELRQVIAEKKATEEKLAEAQKQIRELETRPQPVAVERDERAIEEAAEAARAESRQELEKLQKKLETAQKKQEKAEKERDELREKAGKADAAAKEQAEKAAAETVGKLAEAERATAAAREELEQMKKKLLASDRDVTEFGVHFKNLQTELRAMAESLDKVRERDNALADKLRDAWRKVLTPYMEETA